MSLKLSASTRTLLSHQSFLLYRLRQAVEKNNSGFAKVGRLFVPESWSNGLDKKDVVSDNPVEVKEAREERIETSLTTNYRADAWGLTRIVLDAISNHLPADSGGSQVAVKVKQGGQWLDVKQAKSDVETEEVVFEDDGKGYDYGLLSVLYSTKSSLGENVGQFGEGLKMIAAAALRNEINLEYRSRNWSARPSAKDETIEQRALKRLCFDVSVNGHDINGSRTLFRNPSKKLMEEILQIPKRVLLFYDNLRELKNSDKVSNDVSSGYQAAVEALKKIKHTAPQHPGPFGKLNIHIDDGDVSEMADRIKECDRINLQRQERMSKKSQPQFSGAYKERILDLGDGQRSLFVKGVWVRDTNALFSYDLAMNRISPDRFNVDHQEQLGRIKSLLYNSNNKEVITKVLQAAHDKGVDGLLEFQALEYIFRPHSVFDRGKSYFDEMGSMYEEGERRELDRKRKKFSESRKLLFGNDAWARTFKEMFGENAVLESDNHATNEDAKLLGFNPVRLHKSVEDILSEQGIDSADDIDNQQEYRWIDESDLTSEEKVVLARAGEIDQIVLGRPSGFKNRVYSGLFFKTGREAKCSEGVCISSDGKDYVFGIKREMLSKGLDEFTKIYLHELGHKETGAGDYAREHGEFAYSALGKLLAARLPGLHASCEDYSI